MSNFLDDKEKMRDMATLSKEEFLKSYSYLTDKEYENTRYERIVQLERLAVERLTGDDITELLWEGGEADEYRKLRNEEWEE